MKERNLGGALGCRFKTQGMKGFLYNIIHTVFNTQKAKAFFSGYEHLDMYRLEMIHVVLVLMLNQECNCTAWVALQLFSCLLTVLNKWSKSPLLRGEWKETVYVCVFMHLFWCAWPRPGPAGFSGVFVTRCLRGERAGDNWTLSGTFNKCIERRNRKTC